MFRQLTLMVQYYLIKFQNFSYGVPRNYTTTSSDLLSTHSTSLSYDFISIKKGSGSAIVVDDVLATGGTLEATNRVAGLAGYDVIDNVVLIDLKYVPRIDNFDLDVKSVVSYE